MTYNGLPLYQLKINEDFDCGVQIMSIVDRPAVKVNFLKFSDDEYKEKIIQQKFNFDDDKHIITGPAMIPDMPIFRKNTAEEFYVSFDSETINAIAEKFMQQQRTMSVNLNHDIPVNDCIIIESYFINRERGIIPEEFNDLPDNTWMISMKINDDAVWNSIKNNELNGFSVEGLFVLEEIETSEFQEDIVTNENFLDWLYNQFNS